MKNRHVENMNLSIPEALHALGNLITDVEEWVFSITDLLKNEYLFDMFIL